MDEQSHIYELEFPAPAVSDPDGNGPVLVHALDGFADAGHAVRMLSGHLQENLTTELVASFDADELIDYRSRRPAMTFDDNRFVAADTPTLNLYAIKDETGRPFLLLSGAEPDLKWEAFISAVSGLAERFGVRRVIGLHAVPMAVPHTRPLTVSGHGNTPALLTEVRTWDAKMRMPGSASTLLELRLGDKGYETLGLSVQVPHYLAQNEYPDAALALASALRRTVGLHVPDGELPTAAADLRKQIDEQVASSSEVAAVVAALETQYDELAHAAEPKELLIADGEELPTGEDLADEFSRFLAQQARDADPGDDQPH